jgi:hypothetical protein
VIDVKKILLIFGLIILISSIVSANPPLDAKVNISLISNLGDSSSPLIAQLGAYDNGYVDMSTIDPTEWVVRYTLDGSEPNSSSPQWPNEDGAYLNLTLATISFSTIVDTSWILKARSYQDGYSAGNVDEANYIYEGLIAESSGTTVLTNTAEGFRQNRFNSNGQLVVTSPGFARIAVQGGGGGGNRIPYNGGAAGGGAGGMRYESSVYLTTGTYTITRGLGGRGALSGIPSGYTTSQWVPGVQGSDSTFSKSGSVLYRGKGGARAWGAQGGCGSGGSTWSGSSGGSPGSSSQGDTWGTSGGNSYKHSNDAVIGGGGGGGIGGAGGNAGYNYGGNGGAGRNMAYYGFLGSNLILGGGGGGATQYSGTLGSGGSGVGGAGRRTNTGSGYHATANTGSGGGGVSRTSSSSVSRSAGGDGSAGTILILWREGEFLLTPSFINQTIPQSSTYFVGDYVRYRINLKRYNVLYDPINIIVNLTDHELNVLASQNISDMIKISTGIYEGEFSTLGFDEKTNGGGIQLNAWAYDGGNFIKHGINSNNELPSGTPPSITSSNFSFSTNAESNFTVENLYVGNELSSINWSNSRLDLSQRPIDLDSAINLGYGFVSVDSSNWPELVTSRVTPLRPRVSVQVNGCDTWTIYHSSQTTTSFDDLISNGVVVGSSETGCNTILSGDTEEYCSNVVCDYVSGTLSYDVLHFDSTGGEGEGNAGNPEIIPEFSTIGIILAVMIIGIFSMFIWKKKD